MKALLLCGGEGTRLRPFTHTQPKALLPLAHQPILFHILDTIATTTIREVVIIIGPNGKPIMELLRKTNPWGFDFTFVDQPTPLGLAHTVLLAREAVGNAPFLMYLGDNVLDEPLRPLVNRFVCEKPDALLLLRRVKNPRHFGVARIEGKDVVQVEEKPEHAQSNLALVGVYLFSPAIHQAVRVISPSPRGELEITDAIQQLITDGKNVTYHLLSGWWKDTGTIADLLAANQYLMKKLTPAVAGEVKKSTVKGVLRVAPGSILKNCRVVGPVTIGKGCRISGSTLGPYLAVGDGAEITDCHLSRTLVLADAHLKGVTLTNSIIGERVHINSQQKTATAHSLLVGADAVLEL
ncbi:MAG TPA: glucose-1-phosphate thymidylyltransferase [Firmicutes bacterium]|nr:glucose-1-phosphate thymidylyltransferase [Bacillota bacterium]